MRRRKPGFWPSGGIWLILVGSTDRTEQVSTIDGFENFRYMKSNIPPPAINGSRIKVFIGHHRFISEGAPSVRRTRVVLPQAATLDDGLLGTSARPVLILHFLYAVAWNLLGRLVKKSLYTYGGGARPIESAVAHSRLMELLSA